MKAVEYYYKTKSVIVYLDEDIKDPREALTKAWKIIVKELIKYEPNSNNHPNW